MQRSATAASSASVNTLPVGLWGELSRTSRVREVTRARSRSRSASRSGADEGHPPQGGPGHGRDGGVGVVGGFEGQDLVARLAQRQHRCGDRLGGARGHQDLGLGVDLVAPEAPLVGRDRLPKRQDARPRRVLVVAAPDRLDGGLGDLRRTVLVGEALAEVDGTRRPASADISAKIVVPKPARWGASAGRASPHGSQTGARDTGAQSSYAPAVR